MKITMQSIVKLPIKFLILSIPLLVLSFSANAEIDFSGTYAGLQFSDSTDQFEDEVEKIKENRGHIKAKLGMIMNDFLSIESQFGATTNSGGSNGIVTFGAYLRAGKDFSQYKLYGLVGVSRIFAYDDDVENINETGGSYGAGIEIFGTKDIAITFEYLRLLDKSVGGGDLTFDTFGVGFTYYFTEDKSYFNKNRNKIRSIRY